MIRFCYTASKIIMERSKLAEDLAALAGILGFITIVYYFLWRAERGKREKEENEAA